MRHQRLVEIALVVLLSVIVAMPAWAGGPTQKPDGVGNPSGNDYTGFKPVLLILGIQDNANVYTLISCFNTSKVDGQVAVQAWSSGDVVGRDPIADQLLDSVPRSDVDASTSLSWSGSAASAWVARVSVAPLTRGRPNIICQASLRSKATNDVVTELTVIPYTKQKPKTFTN